MNELIFVTVFGVILIIADIWIERSEKKDPRYQWMRIAQHPAKRSKLKGDTK